MTDQTVKPERICMYTPSADGGHARYTWELLSAMGRRGIDRKCEFELVTSEDLDPSFITGHYEIHPILKKLRLRSTFKSKAAWIIDRITHYPRRDFGFVRWLETRPDITAVHLQEWTPWIAARVLRRIKAMGKRVYYTVHNIYPHRYPKFVPKWQAHRWVRNAARTCDGLFVHTEKLRGELSSFLGDSHPPIHVVPHGIWSVDGAVRRPTMAERLTSKRLLFFGTIRRNKGLHLLLNAMEHLREYSLTIVGEPLDAGYFDNEILPQIEKLKSAGIRIDLRPNFLDEAHVGGLFAEHSAIVLPYTPQFAAQSGVVFLALAHELPVVATHVGGIGDLMEQFDFGVTVREQSPQAFAAGVRKLFDGADAAGRIVSEMRRARQCYSWEQAAEDTMTGYGLPQAAVQKTIRELKANDRRLETTLAH